MAVAPDSVGASSRASRQHRSWTRHRRQAITLLILGFALIHAAVWLFATRLAGSDTVRRWQDLATETIDGRDAGVLALRAVLEYPAVPVLLAIMGVSVVLTLRRSVWLGIALLACYAGANLVIQALKQPPLADLEALREIGHLSGQVGVATALGLGWLVVAPRGVRAVFAWPAFSLLAAYGAGTILTRWHTVSEVLIPMVVCGGWAILLALAVRLANRDSRRSAGHGSTTRLPATAGYLLGAATSGLLVVAVMAPRLVPDEYGNSVDAVSLTVFAVVLTAALLVGASLGAAALLDGAANAEPGWPEAVAGLVSLLRRADPDGARVRPLHVVEMGRLSHAAQLHGVEGWLRRGLPAPVPAVDGAVHSAQARRLRVASDLAVVAAALGERVPFLVVKGPALASASFADPSLRSYVDLDVVVRPFDLKEATERLERAGCRLLDANWPLLMTADGHELHLVGPSGGPIDLHWSIGREPLREDTSPSVQTLLDRSVSVIVDGHWVRTLGPCDTVVHLAVHAAASGGHRLSYLVDLRAALVTALSSASEADLVGTAQEWGARPAVALMLGRLSRTLGHPVGRHLRSLPHAGVWGLVVRAADWWAPPALVGLNGSVSRLVARSCRATARDSLRAVALKGRAWWVGDRDRPPLAADMLGPDHPGSCFHPAGGPEGREQFFAHLARTAGPASATLPDSQTGSPRAESMAAGEGQGSP